MERRNNEQTSLIKCYHNGTSGSFSTEEAYRLFWTVDFAWLLTLDWYRYDLGGHCQQGHVPETVSKCSRFLAYHLMRRGHRALTKRDLLALDSRIDYLTTPTFRSRMSRMNAHFFPDLKDGLEHLRPFGETDVFEGNMKPIPAYRLKPGCEVLLVIDFVPGGGTDEFDWTIFQTPPKKGKSS